MKFFVPLIVCVASVGTTNVLAAPSQTINSDRVVASSSVAIVNTEAGKVEGFVHQGIFTYRGVPYATAARFMPPQKPATWQGIRTALTYSYISPQEIPTHIDDVGEFLTPHRYGIPNDDCQNLNVWTPGIEDGKKRPVMVWFHGGGFTNGSSIEQVAYDGENLSRKGDVVVVTVNHRLNVVGFLDLSAYGEKYKYSANLGIMDLVASLAWVKANIAAFGGDPNNVTIFGQSGGGGKVATLLGTPSAKGLFQKAVIESGAMRGMGMTLSDQPTSRRVAELTLKNLHIDAANVDQLQEVPYNKLSEAGTKALEAVAGERNYTNLLGLRSLMWSPVVDGDFIPSQPFETKASDIAKGIPLLIGSTLNEFPMITRDPKMVDAPNWPMDRLMGHLRQIYGDKTEAVVAAYRNAYPAMKPNEWLYVDTMFRGPTIDLATMKSDQGAGKVYLYLFSWQSPVLDGRNRATHCMEIPFVFNNNDLADQVHGGGPSAAAMTATVSQAWINFARKGDPNDDGLPNWPAYTRDNGATLIFDNKSEIRYFHDKELLNLVAPK